MKLQIFPTDLLEQGEYRSQNMYVTTDDGRIEWLLNKLLQIGIKFFHFFLYLKRTGSHMDYSKALPFLLMLPESLV